jgi:hypothetical protein
LPQRKHPINTLEPRWQEWDAVNNACQRKRGLSMNGFNGPKLFTRFALTCIVGALIALPQVGWLGFVAVLVGLYFVFPLFMELDRRK